MKTHVPTMRLNCMASTILQLQKYSKSPACTPSHDPLLCQQINYSGLDLYKCVNRLRGGRVSKQPRVKGVKDVQSE